MILSINGKPTRPFMNIKSLFSFSALLVPPVITIAPPPFVAVKKAYDTVTLQCAARGSPVPTLEWRKDRAIISANTTSENEEEVTGELVIPKFGPSDQGVYTCFFKNYNNGTAETSTIAGTYIIYHYQRRDKKKPLLTTSHTVLK